MLNFDNFLLIFKKSSLLLTLMLIGSFILSSVENHSHIGNIINDDRKYLDAVNNITPFKTFVFAPIFETFLIYSYIRLAGAKKNILKYIFFGIFMGLFHEYYQPNSFFPILFVFFIMTYGLVDFLSEYGKMISIMLISIIHSIYNMIIVYYF
jgi:hypothetical protein